MKTLEYILDKYNITFNDDARLPIEIPNVGRLDLLRWLKELDFKTGAEIGVAEGEYSKLICEVNPQMKIYGVDLWQPYKSYTDYTRSDTFSTLWEEAQRRLNPYIKRNRYEIVRGLSTDAVNKFDDNSLDFVYIDANHEEPFVYQDVSLWSKKVRPGGIVAGHDYVRVKPPSEKSKWGVTSAVQRYTRENGIKPWFVLGLSGEVKGMVKDGARSWMFIK